MKASCAIASVEFKNFKVLRDATLPLGQFTLIVGPNGSGKSTALQALKATRKPQNCDFPRIVSVGAKTAEVEVLLRWAQPANTTTRTCWRLGMAGAQSHSGAVGGQPGIDQLKQTLERIRVYSLEADALAGTVQLEPNMELQENGAMLARAIERLRDLNPHRFEALNAELGRWIPEFDRILFDLPRSGQKELLLQTRDGHHKIGAKEVSHGTLLALAILTLAHLPEPPSVVGFEEPDRGIHPRLLRDVQDALYRLSYPEKFGEQREPVQVIATTHSPYFLDLYRDHPEEIVIAEKVGSEARFERLSNRPDIAEILEEAPLGEVWFSGVLGGVPTGL